LPRSVYIGTSTPTSCFAICRWRSEVGRCLCGLHAMRVHEWLTLQAHFSPTAPLLAFAAAQDPSDGLRHQRKRREMVGHCVSGGVMPKRTRRDTRMLPVFSANTAIALTSSNLLGINVWTRAGTHLIIVGFEVVTSFSCCALAMTLEC